MIGLKRNTVTLYPHDEEWDICASQTIQALWDILGESACDIRHVGSTSIPAIKAKPIIDIAVAVRHLSDVMPFEERMRENGFHLRNIGVEDEVFFSAGDFDADTRTHHIHVVEYESMRWRNYLNFKAYLNAHPTIAKQYESLKEELAARFAQDRTSYTDGKAAFINYTLRKAMVWSYLGKTVTLGIDRPIGHAHKKDIVYPINYGYIPHVLGGDNEELDVYILGIDEPITSCEAQIIAIVHRENDVEDKLVAAPIGKTYTCAEIAELVSFQEKYYDSHVELACDGYTIREYSKVNGDELVALYRAAGRCGETNNPELLREAYAGSLFALAAFEDDRMLGILRAEGNAGSSVTVRDLVVMPSPRQHDIASSLLCEVLMQYRDTPCLMLKWEGSEESHNFCLSRGWIDADHLGDGMMVPKERPTLPSAPHIRAVRRDELAACAELIRASFLTVAEEFGFTVQNAPRFTAFAVDAKRLTREYDQGRPMLVCCDEGGEPIGFCSLCEKDSQTVELNHLCVHPSSRHQKLGRALLLQACRESMVRSYRHMTIGIVEENQRLRAWYEKYGFVHTGTYQFDFFPFTCGYMKKQLYGDDA